MGEDFIGNDAVAMILGDNLFYGRELINHLETAVDNAETGRGATIFAYYVDDPERFGIVELDEKGEVISIEEKPENPKSHYCITGIYFYDNKVVEFAKKLTPSTRGELEITDLNKLYLENNKLNIEILGPEFTWIDMGTHESLERAEKFVGNMWDFHNIRIGNLKETAIQNGWISKEMKE